MGGALIANGGFSLMADTNGGNVTTSFQATHGVLMGGTNIGGSTGTPGNSGVGYGFIVDGGPSIVISNARNLSDHGGVSNTHIVATPFVNFQLGQGQNGKVQTIEIGPPSGIGYFNLKTKTSKPIVGNVHLPFNTTCRR